MGEPQEGGKEKPHTMACNDMKKYAIDNGYELNNELKLIAAPHRIRARMADFVGKSTNEPRKYFVGEVINSDDDRLVTGKLFMDVYHINKILEDCHVFDGGELWMIFIFGIKKDWDGDRYIEYYQQIYEMFKEMTKGEYHEKIGIKMFIWHFDREPRIEPFPPHPPM